MNISLCIPFNEFNIDNVFLKDKTVNKLIPNSTFCKLMYSNELCHISGIYLYYELKTHTYNNLTNSIKILENCILKLYNPTSIKRPIHKLYNYLLKNQSKVIDKKSNTIVIKIIGIWESIHEYGITYRVSNHQ